MLPRPPRPPGLPASTIWRPKPRLDIPGSIWLPDTGYGALAPVMETYLRAWSGPGVRRRSVAACWCSTAWKNCWMSWNAAKRAMTLGYTHVGLVSRRHRRLDSDRASRLNRASP